MEMFDSVAPATASQVIDDVQERLLKVGQNESAIARHGRAAVEGALHRSPCFDWPFDNLGFLSEELR